LGTAVSEAQMARKGIIFPSYAKHLSLSAQLNFMCQRQGASNWSGSVSRGSLAHTLLLHVNDSMPLFCKGK